MVLITDKFHKASNGTRAEATTLTAQKALAASSISTAALNGWPTDTPVNFQLYTTDTQGNIVPGSQSDWVGIVSGTTITQLQLTGGSDDIYPIGTIVVCLPTSDWADSLVEGILTHADQDGTLAAGAVDSAAVLASNVVTTAKILDSNVTTAKLADMSVTVNKLSTGATTATTMTSETTASATFTDLATVGPAATVTVGTNGLALVIVHALAGANIATVENYMGFAISGASTVAASDAFAGVMRSNDATITGNDGLDGTFLVTGLTPGSTTFTAKYRVSAGTGRYATRKITVLPL